MSELNINSNNIKLYNEAVKRIKNDNILDSAEFDELDKLSGGSLDEEQILDALTNNLNVARVALKGESESSFTLELTKDESDRAFSLDTKPTKQLIDNYNYLTKIGINVDSKALDNGFELVMSDPDVNKAFLEKIKPVVEQLKSSDSNQRNNTLRAVLVLSKLDGIDFNKFIESGGENAQKVIDTFSFLHSNIRKETFEELKLLVANNNLQSKGDLLSTIQAYAVVNDALRKEIKIPANMKSGLKDSQKLLVEGKVSVDSDREDVPGNLAIYVHDNTHEDGNKILQNTNFDIKSKIKRSALLHEIYHSYQDSTKSSAKAIDIEADAYLVQNLYIIENIEDKLINSDLDIFSKQIERKENKDTVFRQDLEIAERTLDQDDYLLGYLRRSSGRANSKLASERFSHAQISYAQIVRNNGYDSTEAQAARQNLIDKMKDLTRINEDREYTKTYTYLEQTIKLDGQ